MLKLSLVYLVFHVIEVKVHDDRFPELDVLLFVLVYASKESSLFLLNGANVVIGGLYIQGSIRGYFEFVRLEGFLG